MFNKQQYINRDSNKMTECREVVNYGSHRELWYIGTVTSVTLILYKRTI